MKQRVFERADLCFVFDPDRPKPMRSPNVDLTIPNHVASSRGQMAVHARANAIDRLTNVDRNLIEVTEYIAADFLCWRTNGAATKR
jgi:hypothetical protein